MSLFDFSPSSFTLAGRRVHYAWVIVVMAVLLRLTSSAMRMAASVFVPFLADAQRGFGWSYGAIGLAFSLQWVFSGLFGPVAGWLGDRYGIRRTMLLGALLFVCGMLLTGTMDHLWQFYLYFGIILSGSMAIFGVPLMAAVSTWFDKNLGVGLGALQASQGLGTVIAIPLVVVLLDRLGLPWTFWGPGIVGGVLLLAVISKFHNEPGELGLRPLGAAEDQPIRRVYQGDVAKTRTKVFLRQAQRKNTFWNLIGIHFWGCVAHNIVLVFLVAMAIERGVAEGVAAGLVATLFAVSTTTRFVVPIVADRTGSKGVMGLCFFLQTAPVLMLFVAHDAWFFYLFAVVYGVGFGGEMSAFPIINRQYFGNAPIGTAYGWQMLGSGLGMAAGAWGGGVIWDLTGYEGIVALSFATSLLGVLSILALPTTSRFLIPDWEQALPPAARSSPAP
ncbi:MAG: MFS transporter [Dehalococcoidia bacterium]|nr:MFS transporter [Dehalococcoidia bacterium]